MAKKNIKRISVATTVNYTQIRKDIFRDTSKIPNFIYNAKYHYPVEIRNRLFSEIERGMIPGFNYIFNDLCVKSINDIAKPKFFTPFDDSSDILKEFEWMQLVLNHFSTKINNYLKLKSQYTKKIILGNTEEAKKIIETINSDISNSLWGYEQMSLLCELKGGFIENRKYLSETSEKSNNYFSLLLCEFCSHKAELDSTISNFNYKINQYKDKSPDKSFKDYLEYKFRILDYTGDFDCMKNALCVESLMSFIDLYETYISECIILIASNSFLSNDILNQLALLDQSIIDHRIKNTLVFNKKLPLTSLEVDNDESILFSTLLDYYTLGKYEECKSFILKNFETLCIFFEVLEILIKCLIYLNENLNIYLEKYALIKKKILEPMYYICICKDKRKNLEILANTIKTMSNACYHEQIKLFYYQNNSDFTNRNYLYSKISIMDSKMINPISMHYFDSTDDKINYLNHLNPYHKFANTISLLKSYVTCNFTGVISTDIPKFRQDYYNAISLSKINSDKAIELLEKILKESNFINCESLSLFQYERIASKLFSLYLEKKCYNKALDLIVVSFFRNESTILKMNKHELYQLLQKGDETLLYSNIKTIIFFYILNSSNYSQIYIALANYIDLNEMNLPSDLIEYNKAHNEFNQEILFILSKIYIKEIMKRFVRINPKDRSIERIKTLKYLIEKDKENKNYYQNQINQIIKEENIQNRIKLVAESKIFVDTEAIMIEFDEVFKEKFKKYNILKELDFEFYDLAPFNYALLNEKVSKILNDDQEKKQKYLIFKELVHDYVNEFLYNQKYGLDKFLGSRIRHGVLENSIFKSFKEHTLLSLKHSKDEVTYDINDYWDSVLKKIYYFNSTYSSLLKDKLSKFTQNIIDKVSEAQNWIRINDNDHPGGMFNYNSFYSDLHLKILFTDLQRISNYELFYDKLNDRLWATTEVNLNFIRNRMNNELINYFLDILGNLETEIEHSELKNEIKSEITSKIKLCKTKINFDIGSIINWFYVRKNDNFIDYDMDELVKTCFEVNDKVNNLHKDIKKTVKNDFKLLLIGDTFNHMFDIMNMLYSNAVKHSGFDNLNEIEIEINSLFLEEREANEYMRTTFPEYTDWDNNSHSSSLLIRVSNNLSKKVQISDIENKVKEVMSKSKNYEESKSYITNEGGSGLIKIANILKYNIARKACFFGIYIDDDDDHFNAVILINIEGITVTKEIS